ncbi:MAG: phosphohistidine phosphatase SixA [Syntrophobacterales bacterium]|nr:MAG: phosphohistidine phosphatase SixA [Syntrophobacterales bacterium]
MEIYLMQHGEAYSKDQDPERSLTPRGEDQIRSSGKALKKLEVDIDIIVSSPKKRAMQTAEIVAGELGYPKEGIEVTEVLEPLTPSEDAIAYLRRFIDKGKMLLAGHLPSLGEIASNLMSEGVPISIHFEMGGVCRIDVDALPTHKGDLRWILTPTQLRLLAERK